MDSQGEIGTEEKHKREGFSEANVYFKLRNWTGKGKVRGYRFISSNSRPSPGSLREDVAMTQAQVPWLKAVTEIA